MTSLLYDFSAILNEILNRKLVMNFKTRLTMGLLLTAITLQWFSVSNSAFGQMKITGIGRMPDGTLWIGRDPESPREQFAQLFDAQIRKNLELPEDDGEQLERVLTMYRTKVAEAVIATRRGEMSSQEGKTLRDQYFDDAVSAVDEILSPTKRQRLVQLMYWLEVKRVGLGDSLVYGRLSKAAGIYDNQKTHLAQRAAEIEAETRAAMLQIQKQAREKLLAELTPQQASKVDELLGDPIDYRIRTKEQEIFEQFKNSNGEFPESLKGMPVKTVHPSKKVSRG